MFNDEPTVELKQSFMRSSVSHLSEVN